MATRTMRKEPGVMVGRPRLKYRMGMTPGELLREAFSCVRIREAGGRRGFEARFVAWGQDQRTAVVKALRSVDVTWGKPYAKRRGGLEFVVPVYSRDDVVKVLEAAQPKGWKRLVQQVQAVPRRRAPAAADQEA